MTRKNLLDIPNMLIYRDKRMLVIVGGVNLAAGRLAPRDIFLSRAPVRTRHHSLVQQQRKWRKRSLTRPLDGLGDLKETLRRGQKAVTPSTQQDRRGEEFEKRKEGRV